MLEEENNELRRRLGEAPREDGDPALVTPGKLGFKELGDVYVDSNGNHHENGGETTSPEQMMMQDGNDEDDDEADQTSQDVARAAAAAAAHHHLPHPGWAVQAMMDQHQQSIDPSLGGASNSLGISSSSSSAPLAGPLASPVTSMVNENQQYHNEQQSQDMTIERIHQAITDHVRPMQGRRELPYRPAAPSLQVELRFLSTACGYGDTRPNFATDPFAIFCLALMRGLELTGKGELERTSWSIGEQRLLESGERNERECCDGLVDCSDPMFDNATPEGFVQVHEAWASLEPYTRQPDPDERLLNMAGGSDEPQNQQQVPTIPAQALANSLLDVGGPGSRYVSMNVRLEEGRGLLVHEGAANKVRKAAQAYRDMGGPGAWQRKVGTKSRQ